MEETIVTENGIIYKWRDHRYEEKLERQLKKRSVEQDGVKNKLLQIYPSSILTHKKSGQPTIKNTPYPFISISHSKDLFALYLSHQPVGVDIQYYKDTLVAGKDYFLNNKELALELTPFDLLLVWSVKEAFYKKKGGAIKDLKNEVTLTHINNKTSQIWIQYQGKNEVLFFQDATDYVVVWT